MVAPCLCSTPLKPVQCQVEQEACLRCYEEHAQVRIRKWFTCVRQKGAWEWVYGYTDRVTAIARIAPPTRACAAVTRRMLTCAPWDAGHASVRPFSGGICGMCKARHVLLREARGSGPSPTSMINHCICLSASGISTNTLNHPLGACLLLASPTVTLG
jgi:hypothetical protein